MTAVGRLVAVGLAASAVACGGGAGSAAVTTHPGGAAKQPAPPTARQALDAVRDKACACESAVCGDAELMNLAGFVDEHRDDKVASSEARDLTRTSVVVGDCLVRSGVPKYRVSDVLGRGRPLELLTHIVGGMCACGAGDRACGSTQLGRYDRFLFGTAERVVARLHATKHAALTARFNRCTLRAAVDEAALVAVLKRRNRSTNPGPSESIARASEAIAAAACNCADRACGARQLLALVAYVQTNVRTRPVPSTLRRVRGATLRTFSCLQKAGISRDEISAELTKATK